MNRSSSSAHHHSEHDHQLHSSENHGHDHEHSHDDQNMWKLVVPCILSLVLLLAAIFLDQILQPLWFQGSLRVAVYMVAYAIVGFNVWKEAIDSIRHGDIFSEFLLMSIATVGALAIEEYPEAVAVMLFYAIGEVFQTLAVTKAKANIKSLIDQRPDVVTVLEHGKAVLVPAQEVAVGAVIQLKPGEKLGLDAVVLSSKAVFNTAALTGESKPDTKVKGEKVWAGFINGQQVAEVEVVTPYSDSKLSKILELVQHASTQKAPTELFIRKFAKIYTPIVVLLAVVICLVPYFFVANYVFQEWLYKSLVFMVISCPCALVISIPLGYFGGIGAASKNGILFKGSSFLDALATVQHVIMDKTGTLTEGVFEVQRVHIEPGFEEQEILNMVAVLESYSTHPIATAIANYVVVSGAVPLEQITEVPGLGLKASSHNKELLVGSFKLLDTFKVPYTTDKNAIKDTVIAIALDNQFVGYITIADRIKGSAQQAISALHKMQVTTTMLSGDKLTVVSHVAQTLGITNAYGELLPEDKVDKVKALKQNGATVAFVGDGVNDAPVIALSDVGMAMGGLGSDAAIEIADVVIQDDQPTKIPLAILIGKKTKQIVWQNVTLAFAVKGLVLLLGAGGLATMWEAVFADVGVALLAILNAVRIQQYKFSVNP